MTNKDMTMHEVLRVVRPHRRLFGAQIQQAPETLLVFNEFLQRERFDRIIEIGTAWGGLSVFLALGAFMLGAEFYTFDIEERCRPVVRDLLQKLGSTGEFLDAFSKEGIERIRSLVQAPGRILLLCDGGYKKQEIQIFSPFLKTNDVIMGHDYFHSRKHHKQQKRWISCELTWDDIRDSVVKHGLKQIYTSVFPSAFWVCLIKE